MGFRVGTKAFVYNINIGTSGKYYEGKIKIRSKKNGEWETTFIHNFVRFIGCSDKVSKLTDGSKIEIKECDVERYLTKVNNEYKEYVRFLIFDFDIIENKST